MKQSVYTDFKYYDHVVDADGKPIKPVVLGKGTFGVVYRKKNRIT